MAASSLVQCPCGRQMTVATAQLGHDGTCELCGRSFLLWPVDPTAGRTLAARWYVRVGTTELGPFQPPELKRLVREGRVQPTSTVRKGDSGPWTEARLVRGLLDEHLPTSPPSAPASAVAPLRLRRHRGPGPARPLRSDMAAQLASHPGLVLAMGLGLLTIAGLVYLLSRRPRGAEPARELAKAERPSLPAGRPVAVAPPPPKAPTSLTPQQIVAQSSPSVAVLRGNAGSGSAFLVGPGLLLTNRHVIEDEILRNVRAQWPDADQATRGMYGVELLYEDADYDLALLQVDAVLPPLRMAPDVPLQRGQEVLCIGSPGLGGGQTLQNAIGKGLVGATATIEGQTYYQLDVAVNPGNSGGPVLDMQGRVVGVVTLKASRLDGVGFCLPVASLKRCLEHSERLTEPERARMRAQHRLRVYASALLKSAKVYVLAGELYVNAMNAAKDSGRDINVGLNLARSGVRELLGQLDASFSDLLGEGSKEPLLDTALPQSTRERYRELRQLYVELKEHVERPSGTLESYEKEQHGFGAALQRLEAHFQTQEGVQIEGR